MSEPIRSLQTHLTVPKELIEAVKRGEKQTRAAVRKKADSNTTHIRRFAVAIAGYVCAAALLIGNLCFLPSLLNKDRPLGTQPPLTVHDPSAMPDDYLHAELLWANEKNGLAEQILYRIGVEINFDKTDMVTTTDNFPPYADDTVYAVKIFTNKESDLWNSKRDRIASDEFIRYLTDTAGWKSFTGPDDSTCFAVTKAEILSLDTDAIVRLMEEQGIINGYYDNDSIWQNGEFIVQIAWQSTNGSRDPAAPPDYYFVAPDTPYIRPDLVWANELNRDLEQMPIVSVFREYGDTEETQDTLCRGFGQLSYPEFYGDPCFAVTFDFSFMNGSVSDDIRRSICDSIYEHMEWKPVEGVDYVWAVSSDALDQLTDQALDRLLYWLDSEVKKHGDLPAEYALTFHIAWQSVGDHIDSPQQNDYVKVPEDIDYYRSDLIWANELNYILKDYELACASYASIHAPDSFGDTFDRLKLPKLNTGDARYAVAVYYPYFYGDDRTDEELAEINRRIGDWIEAYTGWERLRNGDVATFAVTRGQLQALDGEALQKYLFEQYGNTIDGRLSFCFAWQSVDGYTEEPADTVDLSALSLPDYTLPNHTPSDYISPELLWANELNPDYKDRVLFEVTAENGEIVSSTAYEQVTLSDNRSFAVELRVTVPEDADYQKGQLIRLEREFLGQTVVFSRVENAYSQDNPMNCIYRITLQELCSLSGEALIREFSNAYGSDELLDVTLQIRAAWQSVE